MKKIWYNLIKKYKIGGKMKKIRYNIPKIIFLLILLFLSLYLFKMKVFGQSEKRDILDILSVLENRPVYQVGDQLLDETFYDWVIVTDKSYRLSYTISPSLVRDTNDILMEKGKYTIIYTADNGVNTHVQEIILTVIHSDDLLKMPSDTLTYRVGEKLSDEDIYRWVEVTDENYRLNYTISSNLQRNEDDLLIQAGEFKITYTADNGVHRISKELSLHVINPDNMLNILIENPIYLVGEPLLDSTIYKWVEILDDSYQLSYEISPRLERDNENILTKKGNYTVTYTADNKRHQVSKKLIVTVKEKLIITMKVVPQLITAKVGESGQIKLDDFAGFSLVGDFSEVKDNPYIKLASDGTWQALKSGETTIKINVHLSQDSLAKIKRNDMDKEVVAPQIQQNLAVKITDKKTMISLLPDTNEQNSIDLMIIGCLTLALSLFLLYIKLNNMVSYDHSLNENRNMR